MRNPVVLRKHIPLQGVFNCKEILSMRYLFFLISLLLSGVPAGAQFWTASEPESVPERLENALLWRIEGNDVSGNSYLFGTIHLIKAEDYFLPEGTEMAIDATSRMVFEIDLNEMMDLGAQLALITKAFMPDGQRLSDLLNEEDYGLVEERFREIGLPMFLLDRIKPMFLSVFVTADFSPDGLSTGSAKSYEMELYEIAKTTDIPIGGLETMEYQMSVFDSIPYEDQAEMLVEMIRYQDDGEEQFRQMVKMYKEQNIEALYTAIGGSEGELGEHEDVLLVNRNRNWIRAMSEMMRDESVFFAVGAGHLGGEQGVIRLLRNAGYTVTPVKSKEDIRQVKKL